MEQKIFWLKKIDEYELGSKNLKNVSTILNYAEHFHILAFVVAGCIYIYVFVSLVGICIGITSSAVGFKKLCNKCSN